MDSEWWEGCDEGSPLPFAQVIPCVCVCVCGEITSVLCRHFALNKLVNKIEAVENTSEYPIG